MGARQVPLHISAAVSPGTDVQMAHLTRWFLLLVATTCAVLLCWAWIDRPVALWIHAHRLFEFGRGTFRPLKHVPDPLIPLGAVAFVVLGLRAMAGKKLSKFASLIAVCCFSVVTTETIKNGLKWAFGRPWPDSWRGNEPSLIRNGDYQFHWLKGGDAYSSFPSGHMAATVAVLSVLWIYYPRLRLPCLAAAVLVAIALVSSNFHFIGDVLAGAFLGLTVGWMTVSLFDQYPNGWRAAHKAAHLPGQIQREP